MSGSAAKLRDAGLFSFEWLEVLAILSLDLSVPFYKEMGVPLLEGEVLRRELRSCYSMSGAALPFDSAPDDYISKQWQFVVGVHESLREALGQLSYADLFHWIKSSYAAEETCLKWLPYQSVVRAIDRTIARQGVACTDAVLSRNPERFQKLLDITEARESVNREAAKPASGWDANMNALQGAITRSYVTSNMEAFDLEPLGTTWAPGDRIVDTIELHRLQLLWREWTPLLSTRELEDLHERAKMMFPTAAVIRPQALLT